MLNWIKKHSITIVAFLVTGGFLLYLYGCEPKVESLNSKGYMISRLELQEELDHIIATAQIRFANLDQQDRIRNLIMQNALILARGQPFNPVGLITGFAALYGIGQAGSKVTKTVNNVRKKRKVNNGSG